MKPITPTGQSKVFSIFTEYMLKKFAQDAPSFEQRVKAHIDVLNKTGQKTIAKYLENKYINKTNPPSAPSIEQLMPAIEIYSNRYGDRSNMNNNFLGIVLTDQAKDLIKLTDNDARLPQTNEPTDPFFAIIANYLKPRFVEKLEKINDPRIKPILDAIKGNVAGFRPGQIEKQLLTSYLVDSFDIMLANYLLGLNLYDIPDLQPVEEIENKVTTAMATRQEINDAIKLIPENEPLRVYLNWLLGLYTEESTIENEPKISADQFKSGIKYIINLPIAKKLADKLDGKDSQGRRETFIYNGALGDLKQEISSQRTANYRMPSFWR